jgi:tyrosinase
MASVGELRLQSRALLDNTYRPPEVLPRLDPVHADFLQQATKLPKPRRPFSPFDAQDTERAKRMWETFEKVASSADSEQAGLSGVLDLYRHLAACDLQTAQYALKVFIINDPLGRKLAFPTLREQLMERPLPQMKELAPPATADPEAALEWFRYDVDLSDHHDHWHFLYQWRKPTPGLSGRLFLYMHEQCLARYDTERTALQLGLVQPLLSYGDIGSSPFDQPVPAESLAPWIRAVWPQGEPTGPDPTQNVVFEARPPGVIPSAQEHAGTAINYIVSQLQALKRNIEGSRYADANEVGADIESSNPDFAHGAGAHNLGHRVLSLNDALTGNQADVMAMTSVAMTVPVFYRGHRTIDDFAFRWQERQGPDRTTYRLPASTLQKGPDSSGSSDLFLVLRSSIAGIDGSGFDLQTYLDATFGAFGAEPPGDRTTSVLRTTSRPDEIAGGMERQEFDDHFFYVLRFTNDSDAEDDVTFVCLSPRRHWPNSDVCGSRWTSSLR